MNGHSFFHEDEVLMIEDEGIYIQKGGKSEFYWYSAKASTSFSIQRKDKTNSHFTKSRTGLLETFYKRRRHWIKISRESRSAQQLYPAKTDCALS
jgi:hypothetical protein